MASAIARCDLFAKTEFESIMRFLFPILAAGLIWSAGPADAQRLRAQRGEQDAAYQATQDGALSLAEIRARVRVPPGARFIGVEMHGPVTRLKFMRGSDVIWIDVDNRTGRVLSRQ
ncbi:MAG: hypothetical protein ACLGHC_07265 [Alphaproteobacteria bacterium]